MIYHEVNFMEHEEVENESPIPEAESYTPRPAWQIWSARIGLVIFILLIIMYYVNIARGGR